MQAQRAKELKAEVDSELINLEAEFERLAARVGVLRQLSEGYNMMITMANGSTVVVEAKNSGPVLLATSGDNLTVRATRILKNAAPLYMTARKLLNALTAEGWSTRSPKPITIVRNTLTVLCDRDARLDRRTNADGTVGYGSVGGIDEGLRLEGFAS